MIERASRRAEQKASLRQWATSLRELPLFVIIFISSVWRLSVILDAERNLTMHTMR